MKNTSRKPYIYKVTNFETGRYYIGSQCRGKTIGHNYFTSSTNKEFWEDFKTYREEKYKIEIIKEFDDSDECGRVENYMIRDHMLLKDGLCLNRFYRCGGEKIFSMVGTHPSEETRKKISISLKGHPALNKGIPQSEEVKEKISRALKGRIKVSINDTVFESLTEASKYYKVDRSSIKNWVKTKKHNSFYIEK